MKATLLIAPILILNLALAQAGPASLSQVADSFIDLGSAINRLQDQNALWSWEFWINGIDAVTRATLGKPLRPGSDVIQGYKTKHGLSVGTPRVQSLATDYKNNWILFVVMGITLGCYNQAWTPLFWDNDAGAFFIDCMTMWQMYVYFYEDEKAIDYSQLS